MCTKFKRCRDLIMQDIYKQIINHNFTFYIKCVHLFFIDPNNLTFFINKNPNMFLCLISAVLETLISLVFDTKQN